MKFQRLCFIITFSTFILVNSEKAMSCHCGPCYRWNGYICVPLGCLPPCRYADCLRCNMELCECESKCNSEQVCCNTMCKTGACCDELVAYDPNEQQCCHYGDGTTCGLIDEFCCPGPVRCECCSRPDCEECENGECKVCGGDPDKVCCADETCVRKCDTVDGETCIEPFPLDFDCGMTCVLPGGLCGLYSTKDWSGFTEKICSPPGCPDDCIQDTHWCWKKYNCVPSNDYTWTDTCSNVIVAPGGYSMILPYYVCSDVFPIPTKCYSCKRSETPISIYYVDNDSCN